MRLAGVLFAPHYAQAVAGSVCVDSVMLRASPDADAQAVSQLLYGEAFETLDVSGGWAWGRCCHDSYVGYVPVETLGPAVAQNHRIAALSAPVFAAPDIKSAVRATWSLGAAFVGEAEGDFIRTEAGYVHGRHAVADGVRFDDPAGLAELFLGQPYLWGGRGAGGIDCSGLVQLALGFAGIEAPRDSDQQREALGQDVDEKAPLARGDLIFFPGHVGLMVDGERMVHANAYWMAVTIEPLADVVARAISTVPQPILARKRLG